MGESLQSKKSFACSFFDCKAAFSKSWKLEAHICKHTGLKPFSCDSCDKSFCTRYQLTRHELTHSGEKPHKCLAEGCSEAFVTNPSMKNHMSQVHQKEKRYRCEHPGCGKDFNKKNQLNAHMYEHTEVMTFHCKFAGCQRNFPSLSKLKTHEKVHEGYPCKEEACLFKGNTWSEYLKHRKEHKVKLPCAVCQKKFNNTWFLNQHMLHVHSGEKRKFSCPLCDKKFNRRFNLECHVLGDHEQKRAFSCAVAGCGKSFAMKESLWRHGAVHNAAKKKLKLKKNQPEQQQSNLSATACQVETDKVAAKLAKTTLNK